MKRLGIGRWVILILLVIIALLPKLIKAFQNEISIGSSILVCLLSFGWFFLTWVLLTVLLVIMHAIAWKLWEWFTRKEYDNEEDKSKAFNAVTESSIIVSTLLVLVMQFIDSWQINPGIIEEMIYMVFPFVR